MIVYFEDGMITNTAMFDEDDNEIIKVDATMGYSNCRRHLRYIKDNYPFDTEVYTNSLEAFSNFYCWDDNKGIPMIHIRDENGQWKLISEMTDKELRIRHNLEKLYVNGAFGNVDT